MQEKSKTELKNEQDYPIQVIGRHVQITDAMKAYALEKLAKIDKFGGRVIEAHVIMDIQKLVHSVDFIINVNNIKIKVSGRSEDMYASIDKAIDRLERKLVRYLQKIHEHHVKGLKDIDMTVNVVEGEFIDPLDEVNDQIEEENLKKIDAEFAPHKVVKKETLPLKILSRDEAIMKMDLSERAFMVYTSEEDQLLKVIYRRSDGNYGIIEPQTKTA